MQYSFYKYQGTGNDFILLDNRSLIFPKDDAKLVQRLCDRKFGIGADGLILLEDHPELDFSMVYYNSDGHLSTMCGNGGRCIAHLARSLEICGDEMVFAATDGTHRAIVEGSRVALSMLEVAEPRSTADGGKFADTGSPHHVLIVNGLDDYPVHTEGRRIRNEIYGKDGANVNFVEAEADGSFSLRTYERGVEGETLSCGTGATAAAIVLHHLGMVRHGQVQLSTPGGPLSVSFNLIDGNYVDIVLEGEVNRVFTGTIAWNS